MGKEQVMILGVILLVVAIAVLYIYFDKITKSLQNIEENKNTVPVTKRPTVSLSFETVPQDVSTSLLMVNLTNNSDVDAHNVTISSNMVNSILPWDGLVYVDQSSKIKERGAFNLTASSSVQLVLGYIRVASRENGDFMKKAKRSHTSNLVVTVNSNEEELNKIESSVDETSVVEDSSKNISKTPVKKPAPRTLNSKNDKKGGNKPVKPNSKPNKAEERKAAALEKKEARKRAAEEKKQERLNKKNNAKNKNNPAEEKVVKPAVIFENVNASFSYPLVHIAFAQADSQILYFHKRDLLFDRAKPKGEWFENTLTFNDGDIPTRYLYKTKDNKTAMKDVSKESNDE